MQEKLYEQDFLQWTQEQVEHLQRRAWEKLDVENLIEELETLGRSERREFGSHLQVLIMHLLKWQYQPDRRSRSWDTISRSRDKVQDCLEDTPSLRRFLLDAEWTEKYYRRARRDAAKETAPETALPPERLPIDCPYAIDQLLDPKFLP